MLFRVEDNWKSFIIPFSRTPKGNYVCEWVSWYLIVSINDWLPTHNIYTFFSSFAYSYIFMWEKLKCIRTATRHLFDSFNLKFIYRFLMINHCCIFQPSLYFEHLFIMMWMRQKRMSVYTYVYSPASIFFQQNMLLVVKSSYVDKFYHNIKLYYVLYKPFVYYLLFIMYKYFSIDTTNFPTLIIWFHTWWAYLLWITKCLRNFIFKKKKITFFLKWIYILWKSTSIS